MMKIHYFFFMAFVIISVQGCALFAKRQMSSTSAIHSAIMDFSKTRRFHKNDSVFRVTFHSEVFKWVVKKQESNEIETSKGEVYQGMRVVNIFPNAKKFLLTANSKVGTKGMIIPSRFMEVNQKLYLWKDADYPLTQETLDVLNKYHLLQDDEDGIIKLADNMVIHSQKAVDYYYCTGSPHWYERIFTSKVLGTYTPPPLKCRP